MSETNGHHEEESVGWGDRIGAVVGLVATVSALFFWGGQITSEVAALSSSVNTLVEARQEDRAFLLELTGQVEAASKTRHEKQGVTLERVKQSLEDHERRIYKIELRQSGRTDPLLDDHEKELYGVTGQGDSPG
jgi:hypothetical protein